MQESEDAVVWNGAIRSMRANDKGEETRKTRKTMQEKQETKKNNARDRAER